MEDFQSNRAFPSSIIRSPFLTYHRNTIPENEYRTLWCIIESDREPFKVILPLNSDVDDLKEAIYAKGLVLQSSLCSLKILFFGRYGCFLNKFTIVPDPFIPAE
jgi:hypothetical protein